MTFSSNLGIAFEQVVRRHPHRTALVYPVDGERISYHELSILSERIGSSLWAKGLRQGHLVVMFHDKSPAAFAAMLACLRLGIIYANLDPCSPWERLSKILGTCRPRVIINAFKDLPFADELAIGAFGDLVCLRDLYNSEKQELLPDCRTVSGSTPAYVMFTSGSTGMPKGAVISHANLMWFIAWSQSRFSITHNDVVSNVNPIYFDNSVFDFFSAIFSGAALVPITAEQARRPHLVVELINKAGCTLWFSVPSMLLYLLTTRALSEADFPMVRKIIFGGEGFPKARLQQLYEMFAKRADLENVYGPTECTCICSAHTVRADDFFDMQSLAPLGALAQNFDYEILPDGSDPNSGELFLRGPLVGLGYYNDPERSAKSFIQNPRHSSYSDVGYLTGDLVRRDALGWLHFRGRADLQIKHMGYRIELEEIEIALGTLTGVIECGVIYQKLAGGLGQIVAFATTNGLMQPEEMLRDLAKIVPSYMVPRRLHRLESLPKNANGKIDRVSLLVLADSLSRP